MTKQQLLLTNKELKSQVEQLKFQIAQLEKLIFGSRSERFIPIQNADQLDLFVENYKDESVEEVVTEQIAYTRTKKKNHPGREQLPAHLPVKERIIEPDVDTDGMVKIGEEVTETLDYTPASLVINRIIRNKYVDRANEQIHIGQLPSRPLPKAIAESSLLTHILLCKFIDHLPFYRQIQGFKRDYNWVVSKSTINDWVAACCTILWPLYERMKKEILSSQYIQADESPIKVLDPEKKGKTHQGYQWVYYAPSKGIVVFHYRKGRGMHGPKELLMEYEGLLQCDGYNVYDKIGAREEITLVGCLTHARRKFADAKYSDMARSEYALNIFHQIYLKEKALQARSISLEEVQRSREEDIKPLMYQLKEWIELESLKVLPKSPIGKAMGYYLLQWEKLINILSNPETHLDTNLIENQIRPLALGRKNYLFAGSHEGAKRAAMMYSFFGTCKANDVNPRQWLSDVLNRINDHSMLQLEELLPKNWANLDR